MIQFKDDRFSLWEVTKQKDIHINKRDPKRNSEWYVLERIDSDEKEIMDDVPYFSDKKDKFTFAVGNIVKVTRRLGVTSHEIVERATKLKSNVH